MVSQDQTDTFRTLLTSHQTAYPPRSKSPNSSSSRSGSRNRKGKDKANDDFLDEAYRIHNHLKDLQALLHSIRKPYLSNAPPPLRRHRPTTQDDGDEDDLKKWEGSKYLTDRERDEIDIRGRMILRRCRERVGVMEGEEKARQKGTPTPTSAIYSFLPSLLPIPSTTTANQTILHAHRAAVIWTLNQLLAKTSGIMGNMQEERAKRRKERNKTLGGQAEKEALHLTLTSQPSSARDLNLNSNPQSLQGEAEDLSQQLSAEQLQQFESENNALLDHMSNQLSGVLSAEKSLLEISTLQSELVAHLASQTEMVETLYEEAVGSVADIGKANEQLKTARKRGQEGRLFLLIFLLGASAALLFLDWYS